MLGRPAIATPKPSEMVPGDRPDHLADDRHDRRLHGVHARREFQRLWHLGERQYIVTRTQRMSMPGLIFVSLAVIRLDECMRARPRLRAPAAFSLITIDT